VEYTERTHDNTYDRMLTSAASTDDDSIEGVVDHRISVGYFVARRCAVRLQSVLRLQ